MLDLTLKIVADDSQARPVLDRTEQGLQNIERAARKGEPSLADIAKQMGLVSEKAQGVVQSSVKLEEATAKVVGQTVEHISASEQLTAQLVKQGAALLGVDAQQASVMASGAGMAEALGLSTIAVGALAGAAVIAASAIGSLAAFVAKSVDVYVEQSGILADHKRAIDGVKDAWNDLFFLVGREIVGGGLDLNKPIDYVNVGLRLMTEILVENIRQFKELLGLIGSVASAGGMFSVTDDNAAPTPYNATYDENGQLTAYGRMKKGYAGYVAEGNRYSNPAYANPLNPYGLPGSLPIPLDAQAAQHEFDKSEAERKRREEEARREAEANRKAIADLVARSGGSHIGLTSMPGMPVSMFNPYAFEPPSLGYKTGLSGGMPGESFDVKKDAQNLIESWGPLAFKYRFMDALSPQRIAGTLLSGHPLEGLASLGGQSLGSSIVGGFSKSFGSSFLGQTLGAFLPGIGGLVGPLLGKIFGNAPTAYEQKERQAGTDISDLWRGLNQQYGGGADQALSIFGFDPAALHGKDFTGAMGLDPLKDVFADLQERQGTFNDSLGGTLSKIRALGGGIPDALKPYLDTLRDAKVLTAENVDLLAKLADGGTVDFKDMEAAAQRLGISTDVLGQSFHNAKAEADWQSVIDDLDLLSRGGADLTGVIDAAAGKIDDLVVQSMKFGTTIPENMRPWIQHLIDTHQLLDENKQEITDISTLKFGETMQTTLETLNQTLKDLVDTLKLTLPQAARDAANGMNDAFQTVRPPDIGRHDDGGGDVPAAARGGYVQDHGISYFGVGGPVWRPRGTDVVPAMLSRGEFVMQRSAVDRYGLETMRALNSGRWGGGAGGRAVTVDLRGAVIADEFAIHTLKEALYDVMQDDVSLERRLGGTR